MRRFILFHGKRHPMEMGEAEIGRFLSSLAADGKVGASTQNQALSALLFLYKDVLGREIAWIESVVRARAPRRLPVVLTREEVRSALQQMHGTPKLIALLLYGAGLRLLEGCRLRVKDVDFASGQVLVREGNRRIASSRLGARFFSHTLHHLDRAFMRLSGGRSSLTVLLAGLPVLTVTTTGARSGESRSVLLVGVPDQERIILIASNWGRPHHPAWYHNLRANPEITLTYSGVAERYVARQVEGVERDTCWNRAIQLYAGYEDYMRRTGGRQIPIFLLTPKAGLMQGAER